MPNNLNKEKVPKVPKVPHGSTTFLFDMNNIVSNLHQWVSILVKIIEKEVALYEKLSKTRNNSKCCKFLYCLYPSRPSWIILNFNKGLARLNLILSFNFFFISTPNQTKAKQIYSVQCQLIECCCSVGGLHSTRSAVSRAQFLSAAKHKNLLSMKFLP